MSKQKDKKRRAMTISNSFLLAGPGAAFGGLLSVFIVHSYCDVTPPVVIGIILGAPVVFYIGGLIRSIYCEP